MSPRRLWRYASIAFAVEVERWRMFVTPRLVRSLRVPAIDTALTSAMGATPTIKSAARTLCQNRMRGRPIATPLLRAGRPVSHRGRSESSARWANGPSHRYAARWYRKGPSTGVFGTAYSSPTRLADVPRTWRTSGHRDDQEARRRPGLRFHPDRGRIGHLLPPVAGGRRRLRHPARGADRVLREGHRPAPGQAAGGEGQPGLGPRRDGASQARPPRVTQQTTKETLRRL